MIDFESSPPERKRASWIGRLLCRLIYNDGGERRGVRREGSGLAEAKRGISALLQHLF